MFILGNILEAVARILDVLLNLYMWAIIINALLSWVNPDPYNPIVRFLYQVTEPALRPIRRFIPMRGMGIDISPIVAILVIMFVRTALITSLFEIAVRMRY
jgi:YggT family protein